MSTDHEDQDDRALAAALSRLPREIAPRQPEQTWSAIEARLAPRRTGLASVTSITARHVEVAGAVLAAAAAVLCLLAPPGETVRPLPETALASTSTTPDLLLTTWSPDSPGAPDAASELDPDEAPFLATLATLDSDFRQARAQLPASDASRLDDTLRAVDAAITSTRTALQTHPDDFDLRTDLLNAYRDKVTAETDVIDLTTRI